MPDERRQNENVEDPDCEDVIGRSDEEEFEDIEDADDLEDEAPGMEGE